jgi:hypothetical protein
VPAFALGSGHISLVSRRPMPIGFWAKHSGSTGGSWQATAPPPASRSAVSSSATLIASNVVVLSADPFGSQSPPLGNLGRVFVFGRGSRPIGLGLAARSLDPHPRWETIGGNGVRAQLSRCSDGSAGVFLRRRCADAHWPPNDRRRTFLRSGYDGLAKARHAGATGRSANPLPTHPPGR